MRWLIVPLILATGCKKGELEGEGLVGDGWHNPFPSTHHVVDGKVDLEGILPTPLEGTPPPVERLAWRSGFSAGQTTMVHLPGADPATLPSWREPTPGEGGVRMADLTDGSWIPCMAELDAHPDATDPVLLIRPLQALPFGHDIGVVVTTDVVDRPERFEALVNGPPKGTSMPEDLEPHQAHYADLITTLQGMGVDPDSIALAWDFPVGDGGQPLRSALDQLRVPTSWDLDDVRDADLGDGVVPGTWRVGEGTFEVQDFLVDDELLDLAADGTVSETGTAAADLYVHVPASVADAAEGSVPVVMFGHGIFSAPDNYLDEDDDPSAVVQLAEESGWILIGTTWRGLTEKDLVAPLEAATDFGKLPIVTDRLVQGQVNARSLAELITSGDLLDDPIFTGRDGQSLPDRSRLLYYGISLGGIEGAVLMSQSPPIERGVLHVGGAVFSTMLERSSDWTTFEVLMLETVPDPAQRQLLYAGSQLWWDAADPVNYVDDLAGAPFILQEALGDEQVPNVATRALARSLSLDVLSPEVELPWGLQATVPPFSGDNLLVQFDPEVGIPEDANRPAEVTTAHDLPRLWPGMHEQVRTYLETGVVEHYCGADPCSSSNPG